MKGSIGMSFGNSPLMALGLPNRNRCWLNQALFETKPKGILFKKLPGFFMFLFPGKSLVLFVNFFPSLSHPADRIKYLFHPIIPPSEYEFRSNSNKSSRRVTSLYRGFRAISFFLIGGRANPQSVGFSRNNCSGFQVVFMYSDYA